MKAKKIIIVGFMAVLTATALVFAQEDGPGPQGRRPGRGQYGPGMQAPQRPFGGPGQPGPGAPMGGVDIERHIEMLTQRLDLTPEQQEAIRAILEQRRQEAEAMRNAIRQASEALREAVFKGDVAAAETGAAALGAAITEQAVAQAATMQAVNAQLTDEQRQQLEEGRQRMRQRAEQFRRDRDGRGGRFAPRPDAGEDEPARPMRPRRPGRPGSGPDAQ